MNAPFYPRLILRFGLLLIMAAPLAASSLQPSSDWTIVFYPESSAVATRIEGVDLVSVENDTLVIGYDDGAALNVLQIPVVRLVSLERATGSHWRWIAPTIGTAVGIGAGALALSLQESSRTREPGMFDVFGGLAMFIGLMVGGYVLGVVIGNKVAVDAREVVDFRELEPGARSDLLGYIIEFDELPNQRE